MGRVILVILISAAGVARAGDRPAPVRPEARPVTPSVHQRDLEAHRDVQPGPVARPDPERLAGAARTRALTRVVYGYYPYWVQDLQAIRWAALTHLAWFSIEINGAGQITATHGWPDEDTVTAAHAAGVRVDLTFTLFDGPSIQDLLTGANRNPAVETMIDQLEAGGADGISIDFEGVPGGSRNPFTDFICRLRTRLDERGHPDAEISIAGPAVDWTDAFDLDALLDCADWYFIMGYGYFWSGSSRAGPVGILRTPADWRAFASRSMLRTLADYTKQIPAAKRHQIIHGVPYYGREWTTASDGIGASTTGHVGSVTYSAALDDLAGGIERRWAPGVENPWYAWQQAGTWHQVWYDDEQSLAAKYALALDQDIGGVGMWALNYDLGHAALWDLLEEVFSAEPEAPPGHRFNPIPIPGFPFHDERDTAEGPGSYFNYYACDPDLPEYGREWVYAVDVCQPGSLTAHVPEYADRDPDLQLLTAPDQDACLARAHLDLEADVEPGRYLLVVDTYVDDAVEMAGPYTLDVEFAPAAGSQPCAEYLTCQAGECRCAEPGLTDCGAACVDLNSDAAHCGQCDFACPSGAACTQGICDQGMEPDGGQPDGGETDGGQTDGGEPDAKGSSGCQCGAAGRGPGLLGLLVCLAVVFARRRRW